MNTIGLGLRFLLELSALAALVTWGFQAGDAWWQKTLLGIGVPLLAAVLWGVFRVPNDPGPAPVAIPGPLRLLLELLFFGGAAWGLMASGHSTLALIFAAAVIIDYAILFERVGRLLGNH